MTPLIRSRLLDILEPALAALPIPFTRRAPRQGKTGTARFAHRAPGIKLQIEIRTSGNSFTGELAWTRVGQMPKTIDLRSPEDLVRCATGLFRVTTLWSRNEIWYEIPAPPRPAVRSLRQMASDWSGGMPLDHADRELPKLVDDLIAKLREHAVPYVRRVIASGRAT